MLILASWIKEQLLNIIKGLLELVVVDSIVSGVCTIELHRSLEQHRVNDEVEFSMLQVDILEHPRFITTESEENPGIYKLLKIKEFINQKL